MKLTDQQKEFYSSMEHTFNTPGWGLMSQRWKETQDALRDQMFFGAKTMEDVTEMRLEYDFLGQLLGLPDAMSAQKQTVLDE